VRPTDLSRRSLLIGAALLAALAVVAAAGAHGSPDQVNDPHTGTSAGCGGSAPLYQGFLPSRRQLSAVELRLRAGGSFPMGGASFPVRIRRTSPAGEVVGQATASVQGPVPVGGVVLHHVDFVPALVLEPEGTFVIEGPALHDSILTWMINDGSSPNPYTRGTAFSCGGGAIEDVDLNFITFTPADAAVPQTSISEGPTEGSLSRARAISIGLMGTDDLSYASKLRFACSLDGSPPAACTSPFTSSGLPDGKHTFTAQAIDEAGNADTSPALVSWTVDATPPRKPTVRGPRTTTNARPRYAFAAVDTVDPASKLRFLCSLDSRRLRPCTRSIRPRLRRGPHLLRVAAVDQAGNRGSVTTVRVIRLVSTRR
jgi:hypothetical protein